METKGKSASHVKWRDKVVFVMVGLPARGKSYIAHKCIFFMQWKGHKAQMFNVGSMRRNVSQDTGASFFDASNQNAKKLRENVAMECLNQALDWLEAGGQVAYFDATNTTRARRETVLDVCRQRHPAINVIFVEVICDDPKTLRDNYIQKASNSPDYKGVALELALKDLEERVSNYKKVYQALDEQHLSYIKLIDLQSRIVCNKIRGMTAYMLMNFMMGLHVQKRPIYLLRAAECEKSGEELERSRVTAQVLKSLSEELKTFDMEIHMPTIATKNAKLTEAGTFFAENMTKFLASRHPDLDNICVYTSTHTRAVETVQSFLKCATIATAAGPDIHYYSSLNIMDRGNLSSQPLSSLTELLRTEFPLWAADPFNYRFPGGESQRDMVENLQPLVLELERKTSPCVVVSHTGTLELLYGYFIGCKQTEFVSLDIPLHTIIELTPSTYGWAERRFQFEKSGLVLEHKVNSYNSGHSGWSSRKGDEGGKSVTALTDAKL